MKSKGRSRSRNRYSRSRNRNTVPTLNVSARARKRAAAKAANTAMMGKLGGALVGVVAAALALWFGARGVGAILYARSDVFTITRLDVQTDDAKVLDFIEGRGIEPGSNIFGFRASAVRRDFLRAASNYRSMEIVRILPDTLIITVTPRKPLARLGERGPFVVDGEHRVFGYQGRRDVLPVITGVDTHTLRPGARVKGPGAHGVAVLDACSRTTLGRDLVIDAIDVSGPFRGRRDAVRLALDDGTQVDLWWQKSSARRASLPEDLLARLGALRDVLTDARARETRLATVDLTLDAYQGKIAVTRLN